MARKRERAFAAFGAGLFLITSSALTIAVIWSAVQSKQSNNATQSQGNKVDNKPKLQGTKLANFTPLPSIPKLEEIDLQQGTGPAVQPGATVTADYTGAVASTGIIFQSSKDAGQPATFPLNQVIAGWSQGVPGMKVGGTRRLLIPASLAYGANPPQGSGIPANADLVFDVTLRAISSGKQ